MPAFFLNQPLDLLQRVAHLAQPFRANHSQRVCKMQPLVTMFQQDFIFLNQDNLAMKKLLSILPRWLPALFFMTAIFIFSSQPSSELPNFASWDRLVKKGGHAIGYGLLALSYLHLFDYKKNRYWLAWLLAVLFSATDEFHQSFVPGRHPSLTDVLVFDNLGAALALFFYRRNHEKENLSA